ncbi:hypothetical protein ACHAXR_001723, partial [Thalassiosira sp. AJA248-18]
GRVEYVQCQTRSIIVYQVRLLSGKLRGAVRFATNRGKGGLYKPDNKCSKTGLPVIDVLRAKHPNIRVPNLDDGSEHPFTDYPEPDDPVPINCYEDYVALGAARLHGAPGLSGVLDAEMLKVKGWLLRHRVHSDALREEMGLWVQWMSNGTPPYAAYRALIAGRELAADKNPGVRPSSATKQSAKMNCGARQLGAGLECGIEGSLHAVREVWPEAEGWKRDAGVGDNATVPSAKEMEEIMAEDAKCRASFHSNPTPDPIAEAEESRSAHSRYEAATGYGTLLINAKNAFNELNHYGMLWQTRHLWSHASWFVFNCYKHFTIIVVRNEPGTNPYIIQGQEGVMQGDTFGINFYGVTLTPLCEKMALVIIKALQAWYDDDASGTGNA